MASSRRLTLVLFAAALALPGATSGQLMPRRREAADGPGPLRPVVLRRLRDLVEETERGRSSSVPRSELRKGSFLLGGAMSSLLTEVKRTFADRPVFVEAAARIFVGRTGLAPPILFDGYAGRGRPHPEGVVVLDLVQDWQARLCLALLGDQGVEPEELPLPGPEPVLRFLAATREPPPTPAAGSLRLRMAETLDRLGYFEGTLGERWPRMAPKSWAFALKHDSTKGEDIPVPPMDVVAESTAVLARVRARLEGMDDPPRVLSDMASVLATAPVWTKGDGFPPTLLRVAIDPRVENDVAAWLAAHAPDAAEAPPGDEPGLESHSEQEEIERAPSTTDGPGTEALALGAGATGPGGSTPTPSASPMAASIQPSPAASPVPSATLVAAPVASVPGPDPTAPGREPERPGPGPGRPRGGPPPFLVGILVGVIGVGLVTRLRSGRAPATSPVAPAPTVAPAPAPVPAAALHGDGFASGLPTATVLTHGTSEPGRAGSASASSDSTRIGPTVGLGSAAPRDPISQSKPGEGIPSWLAAALERPLGSRYGKLKILGSGGMGTVVAAWDQRLQRQVAIKVPPPHLAQSNEFRARFLREAQALARLSHENITVVHDVPDVPEGEIPVMIMEMLQGTDLGSVLERSLPPLRDSVRWVLQAAAGLDHAHQQGICHRDIKPSNLMLCGERIKLLDFGLAAFADQSGLTRSGMLMGSIPYMPPEQMRGEKVGKPADQFALAATAFQLFTGRLPFDPADSNRSVAPMASVTRPGIPASFDPVLAKGLDPNPEARFASVAEFARALAEAVRRSTQPGRKA